VRAKNVGKNIVEKKCEKTFFYIHTNIVIQKRGKKSAKQVFQKHTHSASKNVGKKIVGKIGKERFLYSNEYREQKKGLKKTRETIFPETHE